MLANAQQTEYGRQHPTVEGHWVQTYGRYYYADKPIFTKDYPQEGEGQLTFQEQPKMPDFGPFTFQKSWRIGPFQKRYQAPIWGIGNPVFLPPESITIGDGPAMPVVCQCRDIRNFVRDQQGGLILNNSLQVLSQGIACWEDDQGIAIDPDKFTFTFNPYANDKYWITTNPIGMKILFMSNNPIGNALGWASWLTGGGKTDSPYKATILGFQMGRHRTQRRKQQKQKTRRHKRSHK